MNIRFLMIVNTSYHKEPNIHLLKKLLSRFEDHYVSIYDTSYEDAKHLESSIECIEKIIIIAEQSEHGGITQDHLEIFVKIDQIDLFFKYESFLYGK